MSSQTCHMSINHDQQVNTRNNFLHHVWEDNVFQPFSLCSSAIQMCSGFFSQILVMFY